MVSKMTRFELVILYVTGIRFYQIKLHSQMKIMPMNTSFYPDSAGASHTGNVTWKSQRP